MSQPDFPQMSCQELQDYVLAHRDDEAAFRAFADRCYQEPGQRADTDEEFEEIIRQKLDQEKRDREQQEKVTRLGISCKARVATRPDKSDRSSNHLDRLELSRTRAISSCPNPKRNDKRVEAESSPKSNGRQSSAKHGMPKEQPFTIAVSPSSTNSSPSISTLITTGIWRSNPTVATTSSVKTIWK